MKWFLLTAIVLSHNILPGKESTPSLRALVACDLISTNIQKGSQADLDRIKKSISNIAHQLNIHRRITVLDRKKFKVNNVSRWLSSIKPNSKDIVLFYFSGHGGRLRSSQGPWPFLVFPESADHQAKALMGEAIYNQLRKKKPRLSLIIFDACNNTIQRKGLQSLGQEALPTIERSPKLPGLETLFLKNKGIIIATAASPGEAAYTTVHGKILGGVFTTGFLFSLQLFSQNSNATWEEVFSGASRYCVNYFHGKQNPKYSIKTSPTSS